MFMAFSRSFSEGISVGVEPIMELKANKAEGSDLLRRKKEQKKVGLHFD